MRGGREKCAKWAVFGPVVLLPPNPTLLERKRWRRKGGEWVVFGAAASSEAAANWEIHFYTIEKCISIQLRNVFLYSSEICLYTNEIYISGNWEIYKV